MRNEAAVKQAITRQLKKAGAWYTMPHQRGFSARGVPDILVLYKGKFLAIEAKYNGNKPSAHQERQIAQIEACGGEAMVLDENNWMWIKLWLGQS
jgi:Holliday junction resolvase